MSEIIQLHNENLKTVSPTFPSHFLKRAQSLQRSRQLINYNTSPSSSSSSSSSSTMDSIESLLTKKLDELELEMLENPNLHQKTLLSKITFLKYLLTAEISAMQPKTTTFTLKLDIAHNNLEQLESLANEPFWPQSNAKIRSKIAFIKSLVANEDQREENYVEEEKIKEIEKEIDGVDHDDFVVEKFSVSTSCSCTSSCFDGGEKNKEEDNKCVYSVDEAVEEKLETDERRFGKIRAMRAMLGFFAAAVVGVVVRSFFSEKGMVYLVPT